MRNSSDVFCDNALAEVQLTCRSLAVAGDPFTSSKWNLSSAYLAGLLTLINPCVLPVLPIVLVSAH